MGFTFIHTADWQLGKAFGQFPEATAGPLREARIEVIDRIAQAARSIKARHILVAGDVWDSAIPSNTTLRQPLSVMSESPELSWWLLPGNHDPDGPDGLWDRVEAIAPSNVKVLREASPVEMEAGVFLLPAPWRRIRHGEDLTAWMDAASTPGEALRIGLAHGGVKGFGTESDTDREIIPPDRATRARLDYLALGDWHARTAIDARTHYSGTPEPDRHKSGARGQVLGVTLESGRDPEVVNIPTAHYDWPVISADLVTEDVEARMAAVRDGLQDGQPMRRTHARLEIAGQVTVAEWTAVEQFLEDITGECASLTLRGESAVNLVVVPDDIDALDAQGSVRQAAQDLLDRRDNAHLSKDERDIAADALRLLLRYGAEQA